MATGLIATIREFFEGDAAVRKVADDPALSAEILLLFRMILADGHVSDRELATLRRICAESFGIGEEDFAKVVGWLADYGYETGMPEALATFRQFPRERRIVLARHLAEIAKADHELHAAEVKLLARTLEVLRLEPGDVVQARG
jgi:uncharacterized tellurite resistance protein B-like protein